MLVFILGILDLIAAAMIPLSKYFSSLQFIILILAALILLKSLMFLSDFASWIDLLSVFFLILAAFGYLNVFSYVMMFWLIQKGVRSIF